MGGAAGLVASATTPPRCLRAQPLGDSACFNVWGRRLAGSGTYALALLSNDAVAATVRCDEGCFAGLNVTAGTQGLRVWDLWHKRDLGVLAPPFSFEALVPAGGAAYRLTAV